MNFQTLYSLMRRATVLFPREDYLLESAVRHNRRKHIQAVTYLRCSGDNSKWILDQRVTRLQ